MTWSLNRQRIRHQSASSILQLEQKLLKIRIVLSRSKRDQTSIQTYSSRRFKLRKNKFLFRKSESRLRPRRNVNQCQRRKSVKVAKDSRAWLRKKAKSGSIWRNQMLMMMYKSLNQWICSQKQWLTIVGINRNIGWVIASTLQRSLQMRRRAKR